MGNYLKFHYYYGKSDFALKKYNAAVRRYNLFIALIGKGN